MRANGAIEGGAEAFVVGDNVYVMKKHDNTVIKVIGLVNGPRKCGGYAVYRIYSTDPSITHSVVVVYHIATKTFLMSPRDSNDADYVAWLATKTTAPDSAAMFEDYFHQDVAPYKVDPDTPPDETDVGVDYINAKYYHWDGGMPDIQGMNAYNTYPQSRYSSVLGSSPLIYTGVRTESIRNTTFLIYYVICNYNWHEEDSGELHTVNTIVPFGSVPTEEQVWNTWVANIPTERPIVSDSPTNVVTDNVETEDISLYSVGKIGATISCVSTLNGHPLMPGTSQLSSIPRDHTIYKMKGKKTANHFAMITLVVAQELRNRVTISDYFGPLNTTPLWQIPNIKIRACAASYSNINNWADDGGDLILEMVLKEAVELFYSLNGFVQEESQLEFRSFTPYMDCDVTLKI